jgi:polysaccharide deacetylase family protein (PEP-CTERM system associated)
MIHPAVPQHLSATASRSAGFAEPFGLGGAQLVNALTVDVEDYFQVSAFEPSVTRGTWALRESRVCRNTERLLDLFSAVRVRATFFVLGWVAERFPALVRRIVLEGHELASHGFEHRLVYSQTPREFREDLRRARVALEAAGGSPVLGYRAPSYSIVRESMWALDVLIDEGFVYDSSIYPIRHDRYGIPDWNREVHQIERPGGRIWELPGSTIRIASTNLPIGGGGYFRLLPYGWTRLGIQRLNAGGQPAIFYLHPWEIDPEQPRIPAGPLSTFRHYRNLSRTEPRLKRLLAEFRFGTVSDVLAKSVRQQPVGALTGALSAL